MAVISTGLYAGFCFAYAFTVSRGLATLTDDGYVSAMRALNEATPSVPSGTSSPPTRKKPTYPGSRDPTAASLPR